jgi:hypothetical protein
LFARRTEVGSQPARSKGDLSDTARISAFEELHGRIHTGVKLPPA